MKQSFLILVAALLMTVSNYAQQVDRITTPCSQYSSSYAVVATTGDITYTPCAGKASIFTGNVNFSGATVTGLPSGGGDVSGSGTATYMPVWLDATTLGDSRLVYETDTDRTYFTFTGGDLFSNRLSLVLGNDTAGDTTQFALQTLSGFGFTYNSSDETYRLNSSANDFRLSYNGTAKEFTVGAVDQSSFLSVGAPEVRLNNANVITLDVASNLTFRMDNTTPTPEFLIGGGTGANFDLSQQIYSFLLTRTITPLGTTGDVTINKPSGTVNIEATSASVQVTNNTVTADSLIFVTKRTNDTACFVNYVAAATGSFTIVMTTNCTATTSIGFLVTN